MIELKFSGASILLEETSWHPEFGVSLASKKLCCNFLGSLMTLDISWGSS